MGFGGVLHAHFIGVLSSSSFYLDVTFITLAMLVIGGMNSLAGAVTGTIVVSVLGELLRLIEGPVSTSVRCTWRRRAACARSGYHS